MLLDGWAAGALVSESGERRIHTVQLPGDMLQMPELALGESTGWSEGLTDVLVRELDGSQIWSYFATQPRLAATMFLIAQEERAARIEWFSLGASIGKKRRLAASLFRLGERMQKYEWQAFDNAVVPLSTKDIAALIGVTPVYASRIIGKLGRDGLIKHAGAGLVINDLEGLRRAAGVQAWTVEAPAWLPR